jgi:hypothetical protein
MRMTGTRALALCAMFGIALTTPVQADAAAQKRGTSAGRPAAAAPVHARQTPARQAHVRQVSARQVPAARHAMARTGRLRAQPASYSYGEGGISCVPYARMVTGMQISGNGGTWWHNAAGTYARGQRPEPGAILAFPGSGGMRRGHVAVVSRVHGPRHIEIDHANWGGPGIRRGTVMRNVDVIDVSERNDWTQVRVQVGWEQGTFGRAYPTQGFIYNRPDTGLMTAFTGVGTGYAQPISARLEEVAELPRTAATRRSAGSRAR